MHEQIASDHLWEIEDAETCELVAEQGPRALAVFALF